MALRLITAPTVEPVTLAMAKSHLRVDHSDDDDLIAQYIAAARRYCENYTARAFVTQTWELVIDAFPDSEIQIPLPALQTIDSIKYVSVSTGFELVVPVTDYEVDAVSEPGWVVPITSGWPSGVMDVINAVTIRFTAGWLPDSSSPPDLAANVPPSVKAAILLHVGQLYANREDVVVGTSASKLPSGGVDNLLTQYRVNLGFA